MSKKTKPVQQPTSGRSNLETDLELRKAGNARQQFYMAALNMSWQLAIVVLVPIFIGDRLDNHFNTKPLWTIIGFVIALLAVVVVVWEQLKMFSPADEKPTGKTKERHL